MLYSAIGIVFCALISMVFLTPELIADESDMQVTIYRDTYGVPHIYGDSEEAVLYGQGYAQAEDRLETLLKAYLKAQGKMARVFGERWIEEDYIQRLCRHAEVSRERYNEIDPHMRSLIEHFIAGVKQYMSEHPEKVPEWAEEPEPYHVVALGRYAIYGWPLGEAMGDLKRGQKAKEEKEAADSGKGSNQWVIGRQRSAEDCVIALFDPHLGWRDERLFHEAHLHGGDLNVFGFNFVGAPCVGLGHNDYLYWACTTGGPDTSDVYEEEINPDNPLQYRYDGEWRDISVEVVDIEIKTEDGIKTIQREIHRTHHGPIVERDGNSAYAFSLTYENQVGLPEQLYRMNKAKNLAEFIDAAGMLQLMAQNLMYADIYGNMYYLRTGRVPVRPEGYDWQMPVPGNTSATEWLGIHNLEDLVQILNPPPGFMQNCNISPGTMMPNSPLTPDRYLNYLYNTSRDSSNTRGRRFLEIMEEMDQITLEEALGIANDVKIQGMGIWQEALVNTYKAHLDEFSNLAEAIEIIEKWDHRADIDSIGMTMFFAWWEFSRNMDDKGARSLISKNKPLSTEAQKAILYALREAVSHMEKTYGSIRVPWGDIHRMKRGDKTWPVAGIAKSGLVTLRAVDGGSPNDDGVIYMDHGQFCTTVVLLKHPVISYSAVPYGQSEYADSPHYDDQAEKLFSKAQLRPTWYQKEELMEHVESEKTLTITR